MKFLLISAIAISTMSINSCKKGCTDDAANNFENSAKKDDGTCNYAPVITLNGSKQIVLNIGESYVELGATAISKEGTSANVTVDNSKVNMNATGVYEVVYSATFNGDVSTATRTVEVMVSQSTYTTDWDCTSDCGTTSFPVNGNRTIVAGSTSSQINIEGFFTLLGGTVTANISGMDIIIPEQTISVTGGSVTLSGTGVLASTGNSFTVDYDYDNTIPFLGGTGSCTATYAK